MIIVKGGSLKAVTELLCSESDPIASWPVAYGAGSRMAVMSDPPGSIVGEYVYDGTSWNLAPLPSTDAKLDDTITALGSLLTAVSAIDDRHPITKGEATTGSYGYLTDDAKDFSGITGGLLSILVGGVEYLRPITLAAGSRIDFDPLVPASPAQVTVGSGEGTEGKVDIAVIATGTAGNAYSLSIVNGDTDTATDSVALEGTVLTVTVDSDAQGDPRDLAAGTLATLINETAGVLDIFSADGVGFAPGTIPVTAEPVPFTGGDDGEYVSPGDAYAVLSLSITAPEA